MPERPPHDWPLTALGSVCSFTNGVNRAGTAYGKGIPFVNVLEVITRSHLRASDLPGRVSLSELARDMYAVRPGDLLFNRTSETPDEVGLAAVYVDEEPVVFGGFVVRGQLATGSLDREYSGYALRAPFVRSQIISKGQGAIRANIGQDSLRRILVPIPPKHEQRAIAEALCDIDRLIETLETLIAKKQASSEKQVG